MSFKAGDQIGGVFSICDPVTKGLVAADSDPACELLVNGQVHPMATTTCEATGTIGKYAWADTVPADITDGQVLQIWVYVTVGGVNSGWVVWTGEGCSKRPADVSAEMAPVSEVAAKLDVMLEEVT